MDNLLFMFQSSRRILCVCPCCGDIVRLSDLSLSYKGKSYKTWMDTYERKIMTLETKTEKFEEKEQEIRDKAAERGRKKVEERICGMMCNEIAKLKYNPYDIKAIWHPVDFVVFDGMNNEDSISDITFLSRKIDDPNLNKVREMVKECVVKKKYEWMVARISIDGKMKIEA
jgi:predicted Holliday junction resolvase-like endonuclease